MYLKRIICLAKSRKLSGHCVAGKDFTNQVLGGWIRPISTRIAHEVSTHELTYFNGTTANLLDIIDLPLLKHSPLMYQTENHIFDPSVDWQHAGRATWTQVNAALDQYDANFWAHHQSTQYGQNDKVYKDNAVHITSSLKLILINSLTVILSIEPGFQGNPSRKRVKGRFSYNGLTYLLNISDPIIEAQYLHREEGEYALGSCIICVSLVELFHDYAFRVIASVITPQICAPED